MSACATAWFTERLLGASVVASGPTYTKMLVGATATATLSVLLRDLASSSAAGVVATLQFAERGGRVDEHVLKSRTAAAIVGQIERIANLRGVRTKSCSNTTTPLPRSGLSLRAALKFSTEYAAWAANVKQMTVKCIGKRPAVVVVVPGGTIWVDFGRYACTTTSTASATPSVFKYARGVTVGANAYKWTGSSGHNETVIACQAMMLQLSRIAR